MGVAGREVMNDVWWQLADFVSRALDTDERQAVLGDLTESRCSGRSALTNVFGLALRRQASLWVQWQTWGALTAAVIPLGMFLSLMCRSWSEGAAIDAYVYVHNGSWTYFSYPGWTHDLAQTAAWSALTGFTLAWWSWTSGFVIGSLSRRATWANTALLLVVLFAEFLGVTQPHNRFNASVFASSFYDVVLPLTLRAVFVALPAGIGARTGSRRKILPLWHATLLALATVLLTALGMRGIRLSAVLGWWHLPGLVYGAGFVQAGWQVRWLPLLAMWPAIYVVSTAASQQWRRSVL
jgi:hypothetical protein